MLQFLAAPQQSRLSLARFVAASIALTVRPLVRPQSR